MLKRQTTGSVVCPSCGRLVGVNEPSCPHCGRAKPGLWGFTRLFQNLGQSVGPVPVIIGACALIYLLTLLIDPSGIAVGGVLSMLQPSQNAVLLFGASGTYPVLNLGRWWTVLSASWLHGGLLRRDKRYLCERGGRRGL